MVCDQCGAALQADASFCPSCQYAAPASSAPASIPAEQAAPIWNPNAAANWCLLFTPAFGAYLHALNWRALGEPDKARKAMGWFYVSLVMLAVYPLLGVLSLYQHHVFPARGLALLYLIVWYFSAARSQANYVKEKFGSDYQRLGWGKPLLIAVAGAVGYYVLALIIFFVVVSGM